MRTPKSLLIAVALASAATFSFAQAAAPAATPAAPAAAPAVTAAAPAKTMTTKKAPKRKSAKVSKTTKVAKPA